MNIIQKGANGADYSQGREAHAIDLIVLHTMEGFLPGTDAWFNNPASKVSAHYGIGLSGETHQYVSEGDTAWACGVWAVNLRSISIEHEDLDNPQGVARTDALYEASAQLVADICHRRGIPCDRNHIKKHNEVSSSHPGCPGNLDVDRIVARAAQILGATQAATTVSNPAGMLVTVTASVLTVRTGPGTGYAKVVQPTQDGYLHEGNTFQAVGAVNGDDIDYSKVGGAHTNQWLKSSLGHFVWAGGTNYPFTPAPAPAAPVAAPAPVQDAVPVPVNVTPPSTPDPVIPPLDQPNTGSILDDDPKDTYVSDPDEWTVEAPGFKVINLDDPSFSQDLAIGTIVPQAGTFEKDGVKFARTLKSVQNNAWYGYPVAAGVTPGKGSGTSAPTLTSTEKAHEIGAGLYGLFEALRVKFASIFNWRKKA